MESQNEPKMESKLSQRMIGICVVIALVIIALPLFLNKSDNSAKETAANTTNQETVATNQAPAVTNPNQETTATTPAQANPESAATTQVTAANTQPSDVASQPMNNTAPTNPVVDNSNAAPVTSTTAENSVAGQQVPVTQNPTVTPDASNQPATLSQNNLAPSPSTPVNTAPAGDDVAQNNPIATVAPVENNTPATAPITEASNTTASEGLPMAAPQALPSHHRTHHKIAKRHLTAAHNTHSATSHLASKTAWVVQMGSFKNKANARQLADRLRSSGFKVFTHVVKSGDQERTRVFIGPESKQASASQVSQKVSQRVNMQGIVVKYNPLAL